jgi:5-methylcytosine-specific restriction endonuclease McrA
VSKPPPAPQGGGWVSETRQHRKALTPLSWDARALWRQLRGYCADMGNDGRLSFRQLHVAVERTIPLRKAEALIAELIDEGFVTLDVDCWVLDWSDQPSAEVWNDPVKRERWARQKRLNRDSELTRRIKERDRNLCRYCGVRVDWNITVLTKNKTHGGSYDHVDPDGDNSFENVVVACRLCNSRKRDRTPDQAGMTLLKPGTTADQAEQVARGPTPGQPPVDPRLGRPLRARARPDTANPGPTRGQPPTSTGTDGHTRAFAVVHSDDHFSGEDER